MVRDEDRAQPDPKENEARHRSRHHHQGQGSDHQNNRRAERHDAQDTCGDAEGDGVRHPADDIGDAEDNAFRQPDKNQSVDGRAYGIEAVFAESFHGRAPGGGVARQ